jgi:hypothetical protein
MIPQFSQKFFRLSKMVSTFKSVIFHWIRLTNSRLFFIIPSLLFQVFLSLFINHSWNLHRLGIFKHFIQLWLIALALFTSLTRVTDNMHHPSDVLAGSVIGIAVALLSYARVRLFLKSHNYRIIYGPVEKRDGCVEQGNTACLTIV